MRTLTKVIPAAFLLLCALLSGCAAATPDSAAVKTVSGGLREEVAPITARFPQLDGLRSVHWLSGTFGDGTAVGPSIYWIEAIVELDAEQLATLTDGIELVPRELPQLMDSLAAQLPGGAYTGAEDLDAAFSTDGYRSSVAVSEQAGVLILTTEFE